jgi:hypothetical protein
MIWSLPEVIYNECILVGVKKITLLYEKDVYYENVSVCYNWQYVVGIGEQNLMSLRKYMANRFGNVNKVKSDFFNYLTKKLTIEFDFCADKIKVTTITCEAIREGHALDDLPYRFYDFSKEEYFDLRAVEQYQC